MVDTHKHTGLEVAIPCPSGRCDADVTMEQDPDVPTRLLGTCETCGTDVTMSGGIVQIADDVPDEQAAAVDDEFATSIVEAHAAVRNAENAFEARLPLLRRGPRRDLISARQREFELLRHAGCDSYGEFLRTRGN